MSSFRRFEFAVLAGALAENEIDLQPRRKVETCKYGFVTDNSHKEWDKVPEEGFGRKYKAGGGGVGRRDF